MIRTWQHTPLPPLKRLQVDDGLLITAERWNLVNASHQNRLKTYFQTHHLAGIVWGLGIYPVSPPADIDDTYKDGRWLEIKPGLAIDPDGNLIIVEYPLKFRISTQAKQPEGETIYLVIRFVNPETLKRIDTSDPILTETFQINETNIHPAMGDIELCRILLTPEAAQVESPQNPFSPGINTLDLRYRHSSESRPQKTLKIAQLISASGPSTSHLTPSLQDLAIALDGLYPKMAITVNHCFLEGLNEPAFTAEELLDSNDCIAMTVSANTVLPESIQDLFTRYLRKGGFLWVELSVKDTVLENLLTVKHHFTDLLQSHEEYNRMSFQHIGSDIEELDLTEKHQQILNAYQSSSQELAIGIEQAFHPWRALAQQAGSDLIELEKLSLQHPLRSRPFMFSELPFLKNYPIQIWIADNLLVILGDLSAAWRLDNHNLALPRSSLRTAQEMGINLLHYIEQKQHFQQLLSPCPTKIEQV